MPLFVPCTLVISMRVSFETHLEVSRQPCRGQGYDSTKRNGQDGKRKREMRYGWVSRFMSDVQ